MDTQRRVRLVALILVTLAGTGGCAPAASPSAAVTPAPTSGASIPETTPSAGPSSATASSSIGRSFDPGSPDAKAALVLANRFVTAFVAEEWSAAYGLLAPDNQASWGGSVTAFAQNWPHPAADTGGTFTIEQRFDPPAVETMAGLLPGAIMARSFLLGVTFPNPQGLVPGPYMVLVAAPRQDGTWGLWRIR